MRYRRTCLMSLLAILLASSVAFAELPWQTGQHTRAMGLGDSLTAGFGALPATNGYFYHLYHWGVFDSIPNTLIANAAVPGANSSHVLDYQVPQAVEVFQPSIIVMTVGGNDLLRILGGVPPQAVLADFQANLTAILARLRAGLPETRIVVGNLYSIPEISGSEEIVPVFNQIVQGVATAFDVRVADVHEAFQGRNGLLLIDRHDAGLFEVHPTNAGYLAMAQAFDKALR